MPRTRLAQVAVVAPGRDFRATQRRVVDFAAYVRECDAEVLVVKVLDLSARGCRIESQHEFEPCNIIWFKIPGLVARRASVVWSRGGEAGCEFASAFHQSALEAAFSEGPRKQLRVFF